MRLSLSLDTQRHVLDQEIRPEETDMFKEIVITAMTKMSGKVFLFKGTSYRNSGYEPIGQLELMVLMV